MCRGWLEADEVFERMRKERERERERAGAGTADGGDEDGVGGAGLLSSEATVDGGGEKESQIRVMLKAKGYKDYKLKVKPVCSAAFPLDFFCLFFEDVGLLMYCQTTTFDKMQAAFRREYRVSPDTRVTLVFDGEALSPDDVVQDADIEDMDCIEVHVK